MKYDDLLNTVLKKLGDKYEYIKSLGHGASSKVFLLHHTLLDKKHALKIMDFDYIFQTLEKGSNTDSNEELIRIRKRFINEAKLYQKINHPNIAKIYDIDMIKEESTNIKIPFIIMQFVDGETLRDILDNKAPLGIKDTLAISKDILDALDIIHQNNIVHRDIKPSNIILDKESDKAILIDFGLAKDMDARTRLTTTRMVMGTPLYMSPEQFKDSSKAGPKADIYSFGVILYEMLTGEAPYRGNEHEVMYGHLEGRIPDVRNKNPGLPVEMDDLIKKAMAKKEEDRCGSIDYYKSELRKIDEIIRRKAEGNSEKPIPEASIVRPGTSIPDVKTTRKTNIFKKFLYAAIFILVVISFIFVKGILDNIGENETGKEEQKVAPRESKKPTIEKEIKNGKEKSKDKESPKGSKLKEEEKDRLLREKEKRKWQTWQVEFQNEVGKQEKVDDGKNISFSEKKKAWEKILKKYQKDNPNTYEDDRLREFTDERIQYWSAKEKEKKTWAKKRKEPQPTPPAVKEANPFAEKINQKAKRIYKNEKGYWQAEFDYGIIMVYIPAGEFTMGSNDGGSDEKPVHKVYLDRMFHVIKTQNP